MNESFNGTESDDDLHIEQSVDEEQMENEGALNAQNMVHYFSIKRAKMLFIIPDLSAI